MTLNNFMERLINVAASEKMYVQAFIKEEEFYKHLREYGYNPKTAGGIIERCRVQREKYLAECIIKNVNATAVLMEEYYYGR